MGFLEDMHAEVQALKAEVATLKTKLNGAGTPQMGIGLPSMGQPQMTQPAADPMAAFTTPTVGITPPVHQAVTDEMVMKLVSDNVANEAIKVQMKTVLNQMGIPSLPETRPEQLPELYARLTAVVTAHGGAIAQQPAATPSLPSAGII